MKLIGLMPRRVVEKETDMWRLRCLALSVVDDGLVCNLVVVLSCLSRTWMEKEYWRGIR